MYLCAKIVTKRRNNTMMVFENIPHVERKIFKRTTMNEIALFFTFDAIDIAERREQMTGMIADFGLSVLSLEGKTENEAFVYIDQDVVVTFVSSGVLVNVPTIKYRDFHTTEPVWKRLSQLMLSLNLNTLVWTFTKGNRLLFTRQLDDEAKQKVLSICLSEAMLKAMGSERVYVEESIDKRRTFTCRYGYEAFKDRTALSLKTMITTQNYKPESLLQEVMETNDLMFDVWFWAASEELKTMMDK